MKLKSAVLLLLALGLLSTPAARLAHADVGIQNIDDSPEDSEYSVDELKQKLEQLQRKQSTAALNTAAEDEEVSEPVSED